MNRPAGIVLIGYRGSGKTTVGRIVAQRLGWEFVDVDEWIVGEAGCSIADIFANEGEAGFRAREARGVQWAIGQPGRVVSVGGKLPAQVAAEIEGWVRPKRSSGDDD